MRWQSAYWIVSKFLSPKRHNRGKTQWTIKILYTAKFTHHDLKFHKVWWKSDKRFGSWSEQTDGQTYRQTGWFLYTPTSQTTFEGGIITETGKIYFYHSQNSSKITETEEKLIADWIATGTSIKIGWIKLVLWVQTSPLREMMWSCICYPHVSTNPHI